MKKWETVFKRVIALHSDLSTCHPSPRESCGLISPYCRRHTTVGGSTLVDPETLVLRRALNLRLKLSLLNGNSDS